MKKHLKQENVFNLIKGVEYGVDKAAISEFDFAEYVKITYNSISFINVSFTLWYIRSGKEYIEQLGFDHIIINEFNLYCDKVSPFHFAFFSSCSAWKYLSAILQHGGHRHRRTILVTK